MVGQSIRRLIPDDLQAEEDEILAKLRAGILIDHYETVRLTKEGRRLDVSLSISPIKNSEGRVVGASKIARDITARKQAEEELVAARAKFESVFSQSGIFGKSCDIDGTLREINYLAIEGCGYTLDAVLDLPFWETPWWRGAEDVQARIRFAAQEARAGRVFRETLSYWVADGSERIVDFAMHPIRDEFGEVRFLHPTGIDITDRMRAETALRGSEERQAFLVRLGDELSLLAEPETIELTAARLCIAQLRAARASFFDLDEDGHSTARRYAGDGDLGVERLRDFPPARALGRGQTLAVDDVGASALGRSGRLRRARARRVRGRAAAQGWGAPCRVRARRDVVARVDGGRDRARRGRGQVDLGDSRAGTRRTGVAGAGGRGARDRHRAPARSAARTAGGAPRAPFAALYEAGSDVLEIGGDWYDTFQLPNGRIAPDRG